jgi:flagellar biosynthesis/type III secretory pathway chaperone
MTPDQQNAAERLVTVLGAENAALRALDYGCVGEFTVEKRAALDALNAATPDAGGIPVEQDPAHRALAARLQQLADENKDLLGQAIKVQNRIMGVVAGAARQAQVPPGYGASGNRPRSSVTNAVALVVRV